MLGKIGKYEIRGEIGRGAMGAVYEGFDTAIGRRVAIKILRTDVFSVIQLPEVLARFRREAQAAGGLSHPHIVTIHDYGEEAGTPYIVMEYIAGRDLGAMLERGSRFALDDTVRIMTQLLGALSHAHQHGIVHRDLKPANIFLLAERIAQGRGLRHRAARVVRLDRNRHHPRHACLHVSGAVPGDAGRSPQRYLHGGRHSLPASVRGEAVHGLGHQRDSKGFAAGTSAALRA